MRKEDAVAWRKVLSPHLLGGTEENKKWTSVMTAGIRPEIVARELENMKHQRQPSGGEFRYQNGVVITKCV
jgi:hypothetical protein